MAAALEESVTTVRPARRPSSETLIALVIGLAAFATYAWQLSVPEQLSFYDSGVYLAGAVHLVSGALPYRDFTFVQPPGLLYLLSPIAALSRLVGTHDGLTVGRLATSAVAAANCSLSALLVRHRGWVAMLVAGAALAVSPVALLVSSSIKLEPYCIFFVLVAALTVLGRGEVATLSRRAAAIAGIALGIAGLVKLWALFPFVAIVVLVAYRARHRLVALVASAGATFLVGVAPFLVAAPRAFISEVFVEQLGRRANASDSASLVWRVRALTGYLNTLVAPSARTAEVAFAVLVVLAGVAFWRWREVNDGDLFVLLGTVAVVVMLLVSPETYTYYDYFAQPFVLALAVVVLWRVATLLGRRLPRPRVSRATGRVAGTAVVASLVLASGAMVLYTTSFYSAYAFVYGYYGRWMDPITRVIPGGACVVYNQVSFGVYANRLITPDARCPDVVDIDGEWMAHGYQLVAPTRAFSEQWRGYFERAQYVVFTARRPGDVPWDASLTHWFASHFRLVFNHHFVVIYRADGATGT